MLLGDSLTHLLLFLRRNRVIVAFYQSSLALCSVFKNRSTSSFSPNWIKRKFLIELIKKHDISHFIETGTYIGQTSVLIAKKFPKIYVDTIEVDETLFNGLQRREVGRLHNIKFWKFIKIFGYLKIFMYY